MDKIFYLVERSFAMYIGELKSVKTTFTHEGTSIPFPPSYVEEGLGTWEWKYTYDSPIDINFELEAESFIGSLTVSLTEDSLKKIEVLVDGKICGYNTAKTGELTGGTVTLPVGAKGSLVTLRLHTELCDVTVGAVEILGAYDDEMPLVWPVPKNIEFLGGFSKIKDVVSKNGDEDELYAVEFLKERLAEQLGDWKSEKGRVVVFDKKSSKSYDGERYTVKTSRERITVAAKSRLTLLYGADTLIQLTEYRRGVRKFNCDDRPSKEFRGFHTGTPKLIHFEFLRRFFKYVLLPLRYNMIFIEIAGSMRYDSHPEITAAWEKTVDEYRRGLKPTPPHYDMLAGGDILEKEDIKRLVGFGTELGFEVIPEVQSLGHVQYITIAHPELAEIDADEGEVKDTRAEDAKPSAIYPHCYCPSLEESYKIIFDIIDEVVDVFKPKRYLHIGHDEIYKIGVCKRCRTRDAGDIYAEHVTRLHDHLAKKGLGTMMWSDMIHPAPVRNYKTYTALKKLPRDVIMLDFVWYFSPELDIEDNLLPVGYKVAVGNLYSSHYTRYRSRVMKKNMLGGEVSTWLFVDEETFGNNGKIWDAIYLSEMLWNIESYDERNRRAYTEIIAKSVQPKMRDNLRAKYNPAGYKATKIKLPNAKKAPDELLTLCPRAIMADGAEIEINAAYDRLVFEHATLHTAPRIVWIPFTSFGSYVVTYEGGESVEIPLKYAENVMCYKSTYGEPMPNKYYRHNGYVGTWFADPVYSGKTASGEDMTVTGFVWENPNPEKKILKITYRPEENQYCDAVIAGIKGYNKNA